MSQIDGLPPLREVIETHGLSARKALGQNFLLGPDPDRADCARRRRSGQFRHSRDWPRSGRADARAAGRGRAPGAGDREGRALHPGAGGNRGSLSGAARGDLRRRAGGRSDAAADAAGPGRGQPALQYRHRTAGALADPARMAALLDLADADVPARGGRADHRPARRQGLWPAGASGAMALRCARGAGTAAAGLYPAAQGLVGGGASDRPARAAPSRRSGDAEQGGGGGLQPAAQDAALGAEIAQPADRGSPERGRALRPPSGPNR